jgi:hypothetical protein
MHRWDNQEARYRAVSRQRALRARCRDCRNYVWVDDLRAWERGGCVCATCFAMRMQGGGPVAAEARPRYAEG